MSLKVVVIGDNGRIPQWALNALDSVQQCSEFTLLSCTNTSPRRRILKHGLYYGLNLVTVRNPMTRGVEASQSRKRLARTISFRALNEGLWQRLPEAVLNEIAELKPDIILKFGMNLLRVPDATTLQAPILSYHHGDPDEYRGRPAGFYEILHGRGAMGQVVQLLSDRLDGGKVLAFGETKVRGWSYRATLVDAFRHSEFLINEAIRNVIAGRSIPKSSTGPNYRLPSNLTVCRFVLRLFVSAVKRLFYGTFFEKHWHVSVVRSSAEQMIGGGGPPELPPPANWQTLPCPPGYRFLADPFLSDRGEILVEGFNARTARGDILLWNGSKATPVSGEEGHYSYPSTLSTPEGEVIVPEIVQWSPPRVFQLRNGKLLEMGQLAIEGNPRILDPTLFGHEGHIYLFGNVASTGSQLLCLWVAPSLSEPFSLHPASPVAMSPRGARMGGGIIVSRQNFRIGQNFLSDYGDGLFIFRIDRLSPTKYSETRIAELRLTDRRGPHTLNFRGGEAVFDWYIDRFSALAGVRRLAARFSGRKRPLPTS